MVPRSVLEALRVWKQALPKRISRNRTYIVWHGDPSPPLHGLLSPLTDVAV
jgi:hypothetical protein